jgi:hypothetical protein
MTSKKAGLPDWVIWLILFLAIGIAAGIGIFRIVAKFS